jgi:hypothetical protein
MDDTSRPIKVLEDKFARAGLFLYWLDGNHEDFDTISYLTNIYFGDPTMKIAEVREWASHDSPVQMSDHIFYLPRSATWEWEGVKFMALGGATSIDRASRTKYVSWWPEESIKAWDVHRALQRAPVDVLLTHDFPEGVPRMAEAMRENSWHLSAKLERDSRTNRALLETVREYHHPQALFHGHMHFDYVDIWKGTKVRGINCNGTGNKSWFIFDTEEFHKGIIR